MIDSDLQIECPGCGPSIGHQHDDWCDVERCPDCGGQLLSCGCDGDFLHPRLKWTGTWPGVKECQEFGWYCKMSNGAGWVPCDRDEPGATEDLNRLYTDAVWNAELGRFVIPDKSTEKYIPRSDTVISLQEFCIKHDILITIQEAWKIAEWHERLT